MKILVGILAILFFGGLSSSVVLRASAAEQPEDYASIELVSVIDDIEIPTMVIIDAQNDHLGHAITEASEIQSSGDKAYRLRLSRDDSPKNGDGIYLIFDSDWELIEEVDVPQPKPETTEDENEDKDDQSNESEADAEEEQERDAPGNSEAVRRDEEDPDDDNTSDDPNEDEQQEEEGSNEPGSGTNRNNQDTDPGQ